MKVTELLLQEIERGEGLTLAQLARRIPRSRHAPRKDTAKPFGDDKPLASISMCAVWRWVTEGVKGPNGEIIKLETCRMAGKYLSTMGALTRFIRLQSPADDDQPEPIRTPTQRKKAAEIAGRKLAKAGI